jgi:hypothetical protein
MLGVLCLSGIIVTLFNYFAGHITVSGWTSLILLILLVSSFQFIAFGILGEYFWNNLEQTRKRPLFIIDKVTNGKLKRSILPEYSTDSITFFDLKTISSPVIHSLKETAARVIDGPQIILGPEVERFECELARYIGMQYAVGVGKRY